MSSHSLKPYLLWTSIALFGLIMLTPLLVVIRGSFDASLGDEAAIYNLDAWRRIFSSPALLGAITNTIILSLATQIIALPLGIFLAWLIGRTDIPGRRLFEFLFWISFFLPPLAIVQGWVLLLDPQFGLFNSAAKFVLGSDVAPFNIYTYGGIIFAHLCTTTVSAKVMLLTPAFQNMDSRLEEAARIAGDNHIKTAWRITLPILMPAILVTGLMGIIRSLESFEIEMFLGAQKGIEVYSTKIYRLIRGETADYASASALGVLIIILLLALVIGVKFISRGEGTHTTISGGARANLIPLGKWRWPATLFISTIISLLTALPVGLLLSGSFMSLFGFFEIDDAWTLANWHDVLNDRLFTSSLWNTVELAAGSALLCVVLSFAVAYGIVRGPRIGRAIIDAVSWVPYTMPGVLFSMAIFWIVIQLNAYFPLYGSTAILAVTIALASVTMGAQLISANLRQLSRDLEEAAWTSGASRLSAVISIVIPLASRSLAVVAIMAFVAAARNIGHISLLASSDNRPLALLQLEFLQEGRYEASAVVGSIIVIVTTGAALLLRKLNVRDTRRLPQ